MHSLGKADQTPLGQIINRLGKNSSVTQKLPSIITSLDRLLETNHRIYFLSKGKTVIGFLKVGEKKLFYTNSIGKIVEMTPVCVLDFYVDSHV